MSLRCYDQHYCSGVILDSCTILTAAHCVIGFPLNDLSIKIGSTNNKLGKEYKISTLSIHPEFNQTKELDFDAVILKVFTDLIFFLIPFFDLPF